MNFLNLDLELQGNPDGLGGPAVELALIIVLC